NEGATTGTPVLLGSPVLARLRRPIRDSTQASGGFSLVLPAHFGTRVRKDSDGCWLWTGWVDADGYGRISVNHKGYAVHRLAYEALVGPIPAGCEIDHLCRKPACVNPLHLEPVTHLQNI